ncbi:MAG: DUF2167 domain-containing protein [Polyangiales bacterium]
MRRFKFLWLACLAFPFVVSAQEPESIPEMVDEALPGEHGSAETPEAMSPEEAALAEIRAALTPEEFEELSAELAAIGELEASLSPQSGVITLGDGLATIDVGENLRYLSPEDTNRVIQAWQNPPMPDTLGMLIPTDRSLFGETNWAVVMTYAEDGWVDDEDADDLDYDELLEEMQSDTETENEERVRMGLPTMRLLGWAEPPHYDANTHRLYWAKHLETDYGGELMTNLNYSTRVLGRRGVLELNAVAGIEMLDEIRGHMGEVLGRVEFESGHRYEDFDPELDDVAAYGIGALILGKFAAKAGFFAMIGLFLLKMKKLLVLLVLGGLALAKRFFGRSPAKGSDDALSEPDDSLGGEPDGLDDDSPEESDDETREP